MERSGARQTIEVTEYVLPLVVRVERSAPPARTDATEAAAQAVLTLLADPRAIDGDWAAAVRAWDGARIRKVVRRARGADWRRVLELPGITIARRSAEVRVYPPVPVDAWPAELARLQVSGTELDDPEPPPVVDTGVPVLWLNPQLSMTAGKTMAQVGHAAHLAWRCLPGSARSAWQASGFELVVRTAPQHRWPDLVTSELPVVRDGGFTELAPGTCTVVADLPALRPSSRNATRPG
jgi:peptidyl-tRNA hydrolase